METLARFLFKAGITVMAAMVVSCVVVLIINASYIISVSMIMLMCGLSVISALLLIVGRGLQKEVARSNKYLD